MALRQGITAFVVFNTGKEILERCLSSVAGVVDEVVAVDTGSDEQTRAIAEKHGARIYDLVWPESFAAAYNFAIERVETEWTLWLDSDEWLSPEAGVLLRDAVSDKGAFAYRIIREDFYSDTGSSEMFQLRLWRTNPSLRLVGHIHAHFPELALRLASMGRRLKNSSVRILHDGFKGGISDEKLRRNIAYLERELRERPGQLYFEICLAETLHSLGEPRGKDMVRAIVDKHLDSDAATAPQALLSVAFALELQDMDDSELDSARTESLIRLAWRWFSKSPTVVWNIAGVELRRGNVFSGYYALLELDELSRGGYDRLYSFDPEVFGKGLYVNLAQSAAILNKPSRSFAAIQRARELAGDDEEVLALLRSGPAGSLMEKE